MPTKEKNTNKRLLISALLLFLVQVFASKTGEFIAGQFDYSLWDKDNAFMNITVHHLVQMMIALAVISFIRKKCSISFGLKPRMDRKGLIYTLIFASCFMVYVSASYIIGYMLHTITPAPFELNVTNVLGTLGFQLFLSGTSEEILFRALPIAVLVRALPANSKKSSWIAVLTAAFFFSAAHISWSINPFTISFSWFQLIYAFVLGIIYGFAYLKTKLVIYPAIMHGLSNFLMVGAGYFAQVMW